MTKPGTIENAHERLLNNLPNREHGTCWLWSGKVGHQTIKNNLEYAYIRVCGKKMVAHKLAYIIWNGPVPDGMKVLHQCDTPLCCNPNHLRLGTQLDNVRDCVSKGRNKFGCGMATAKLDDETVRLIRSLYVPHSRKFGTRALAKQFGVSHSVIGGSIRGKRWKHVK